ncbi:DUF4333 domain-containing protein [Amycolatopsis dongchuanensis]|uniref:DUF4333 domain-containing protein n=1 Tax=Amycolatopsis dongchuanensis TaxID=1070866 RepID=A0ABP9Q002_9PSEU
MSTPYGGNDPQQWGGQAPGSGGFPAQGQPGYPQQPGCPQTGGFPAQPAYPQQGQYPPAYPQQGQYPQQPAYPQQPQYPQQPYYGQQQPPQGQYDYGTPSGFGAPVKKGGGSGKLLWIITGVVVVVLAVVGITGFWQPGFFITKVLDQTAVQNGVKQMLATYGDTATAVSCPPDQEVKAGTTFTCTATIGGRQRQVTVTVQDGNGNYQVGHPR